MQLRDCFIEVMGYVTGLIESVEMEQPPYEKVRDEIQSLLSESERHAERGAVAREDFDLAFFAVCAWIDEAILSSCWQHKNLWLNGQLQRLYFKTTDAGEEFYRYLDKVPPNQREVREIYYLCLALGFAGRYCRPGDQFQLEQISAANLKAVLGSSACDPLQPGAELFPEAYPANDSTVSEAYAQKSSRLVTAICLAAPVLLYCILYLVYRFTLGGISENFLRTVAS